MRCVLSESIFGQLIIARLFKNMLTLCKTRKQTIILLPSTNEVWGQGNMFTGVCLSTAGVCPGGGWSQGDGWSRGWLVPRGGAWSGRESGLGVPGGDPPRTATAAGGTHPTGMHSCYNYLFVECEQKPSS